MIDIVKYSRYGRGRHYKISVHTVRYVGMDESNVCVELCNGAKLNINKHLMCKYDDAWVINDTYLNVNDAVVCIKAIRMYNVSLDKNFKIRQRKESQTYVNIDKLWNTVYRYNIKAQVLNSGLVLIIDDKPKYLITPNVVDAIIPSIAEGFIKGYIAGESRLRTVKFASDCKITRIPSGVFNVKPIEHVDFPAGLRKIDTGAFAYCNITGKLVIPKNVQSIGSQAFYNNGAITEIEFRNSGNIRFMGSNVFNDINLVDIKIPNGIENLDSGIFMGCNIGSLFIPKSVKNCNNSAFIGCTIDNLYVSAKTLGVDAKFDSPIRTRQYCKILGASVNNLIVY